MKIGFYAPMKPPTHASPSGDRTIARLLMRALEAAGHQVQLVSELRSLDIAGQPAEQHRIETQSRLEIARILESQRAEPRNGIDLWFTYHLFHKAPDWIGPAISQHLSIPYVIAEASYAPKQKNGPWKGGLSQVEVALKRATGVISLNPRDIPCVQPFLSPAAAQLSLLPFAEDAFDPSVCTTAGKQMLATVYGLPADRPWLISVAMMRPGDKLCSYQMLAKALEALLDEPWHLVVIGDGEARESVVHAFDALSDRAYFCGALESAKVEALVRASDLFVWPAVNEAFGMAILEAQRLGAPVVAGYTDGVATIVIDQKTGLLTHPKDLSEFTAGLRDLLQHPSRREEMGRLARENFLLKHNFRVAKERIGDFLNALV